MLVHPLYDPAEKIWIAEDGTFAKSLAALKLKLAPGSRIKDYYPNGYGNVVRPRKVVKTEPWKEPLIKKLVTSCYLVEEPKEEPLKVLKPAKLPGDKEVMKQPVVKKTPVPSKMLREPSVYAPVDWKVSEPILRKMFDTGASPREIATALNCSVNAVLGRSHRIGFNYSERDALFALKKL